MNGGLCLVEDNGYTCLCISSYTGSECQIGMYSDSQ